jgi:hypothetical protein
MQLASDLLMRLLFFLAAALAAGAAPRDWRNIETGLPMPAEAYADQPYVVVTRDGKWVCLVSIGPVREGAPGNRTVATVSADRGKTWSRPVDVNRTYAVPLLTPYGRIYSITPQHLTWSDDGGATWSARTTVPMRPAVGESGRVNGWTVAMPVVAGGSVWVPWAKINQPKPLGKTEVFFLSSDNILAERDAAKLRWTLHPDRDRGILPPAGEVAEEPHLVELSDGTLYAVFRTELGIIGHVTSRDRGVTWSEVAPLAYADGRPIRNPRACPSLWKTANGRYLLWFHNHGGRDYHDRNPAWISAGTERNGRIEWSQPEVLLYGDDLSDGRGRLSYPGFFEDGGRYYITTTQKTVATVHAIDTTLFNSAWTPRPPPAKPVYESPAPAPRDFPAPQFPNLLAGGFTLEIGLAAGALASPGAVLLDGRNERGAGILVTAGPDRNLRFQMADAHAGFFWDSDPGAIDAARPHHAAIIVDGGPNIVSYVIDGAFHDGGSARQFGWGRFSAAMTDVNGAPRLRLGAGVESLRTWDRSIRTAEAIALFRARAARQR